VQAYPEAYEKKYGFLKPAVEEVVDKYLECGDLTLIMTRPSLGNGWAVPANGLEVGISKQF